MSCHIISIIIWLFVLVRCVHAKGSKEYDTLSQMVNLITAAPVLAKEPYMSSSHPLITNCVIRHICETFGPRFFF